MPSGEIIEARRHFNCLTIVRERGDERLDICHAKQGFVTNTGRFVNRQQAYLLQMNARIPSVRNGGMYMKGEVFSEDLY